MKRIFYLLLCTSFILSFSACDMSAEITEADTVATAETTTVSVTTTPEATTETAISTTSEYEKFNSKDNAAGENAERFAELFWNVSENGDAGFVIPLERYCSDYELYRTADALIDGGRGFFSVMTSGIELSGAPGTITGDTDENAYYPVNPECVYGCTTTAELYSRYCEFFAGSTGYDGFYSSIGKHFADIDGKLSTTIMAQGFMGGGFLEWSRRKTLIFDVTDETAEVLVAVPETIMNDEPRDYEIYTFFHISLVNTENGWRLTDEMYYSMN